METWYPLAKENDLALYQPFLQMCLSLFMSRSLERYDTLYIASQVPSWTVELALAPDVRAPLTDIHWQKMSEVEMSEATVYCRQTDCQNVSPVS